jgi:hypothetical protein
LLTDTAGTIPEANKLVPEFLCVEKKASKITRAKALPGADFDVKITERYLEHGLEPLMKAFESMSAILDERRGSMVTLDGVKKRCNILR